MQMAIDEETRATIVRLSRAEGWSVGTIARYCGVHHSTVTRALRGAGHFEPRRRARLIDPFVPFIEQEAREGPRSGGQHALRAGLRTGLLRRARPLPSQSAGSRPEARASGPFRRCRCAFLPANRPRCTGPTIGRVRIGRIRAQADGASRDPGLLPPDPSEPVATTPG